MRGEQYAESGLPYSPGRRTYPCAVRVLETQGKNHRHGRGIKQHRDGQPLEL